MILSETVITSVPKLISTTWSPLVSSNKSAALSAIENTPDNGIHIIKKINTVFNAPTNPPISLCFLVLCLLFPNLSIFLGLINR